MIEAEMTEHLNFYATVFNDLDNNPQIRVILNAGKNSITTVYTLGGLSNKE